MRTRTLKTNFVKKKKQRLDIHADSLKLQILIYLKSQASLLFKTFLIVLNGTNLDELCFPNPCSKYLNHLKTSTPKMRIHLAMLNLMFLYS